MSKPGLRLISTRPRPLVAPVTLSWRWLAVIGVIAAGLLYACEHEATSAAEMEDVHGLVEAR